MNHPRLRQRVEIVNVQFSPNHNMTNEELLLQYLQAKKDKLAESTRQQYRTVLLDLIRYVVDPRTGAEVPFRMWNKKTLWGYLTHAEANYCAYFQPAPWGREGAMCKMKVWCATKPVAEAVQAHCVGCQLYKPSTLNHRVNAISSLFKYLARIGIIEVNYGRDVVDEYWEDYRDERDYEKRRNPTLEEERQLVNGTTHPRNRFVYAATAHWWLRAKDLFSLDRYASFGLPMPKGHVLPLGFDKGFLNHPYLKCYDEGGDLVYIPRSIAPNGAYLPEKRGGNRWLVINGELRPIADQYFAWWERTVLRDENGVPLTTQLLLTDAGRPMDQGDLYEFMFYEDCERLGLMQPGDRANTLRRWTLHCQRHFGQRLNQMLKFPADWNHHFRGDKIPGARKDYYYPLPEEVRDMFLDLVPKMGFKALPDAPRLCTGSQRPNEHTTHRLVLGAAIERTEPKRRLVRVKCMEIVEVEGERDVDVTLAPIQVAASVLYAYKIGNPTKTFLVRIHEETRDRPRPLAKSLLLATYRKALEYLGGAEEAPARNAREALCGRAPTGTA